MDGSLIRVCDEMQCPYSSTDGCRRYYQSTACHLAYESDGKVILGFEPGASQYWLFARHDYDRYATQIRQEQFLAEPENIMRAERTARLERAPYKVTWKNHEN